MDYKFMTPIEVWADCNPVSEPLDTEVIRTYEKDGVVYEKIYFTVKKAGLADLRAYVLTARPKKKGTYPTLLVTTVSYGRELDESLFGGMTSEGYCVVAVDLEGEKEGKQRYTFYPDDLDYCNKERAGRHIDYAEPSSKETVWYNWTYIARRVITLIGELDYADKEKIVMIGINDGCPIMWQTAAMDARLSGCVSIFGYNLEVKESEKEEMDCWLSGVDPRSYAPFVTMPVLHVSGTNMQSGVLETTEKIVEKMNEDSIFYSDYEFGMGFSLSGRQVVAVKEFIKKIFAGESFSEIPTFETETEIDGDMKMKITAPGAKSAEIWYSYIDDPEKMFWKKIEASKKGGELVANFSLGLSDEKVIMYARANYGKYSLTSRPKHIQTSTSGASVPERRSTKILFDGTSIKSLTPIVEGSFVYDNPLGVKEGALGLMGITSKEGGFGYILDPEQPIDVTLAESMQFEVFTLEDCDLEIRLKSGEQTYCTSKHFRGSTGWQRVHFSSSAFKNVQMQKLSSFEELWKIEFPNIEGVLIRNVLLI